MKRVETDYTGLVRLIGTPPMDKRQLRMVDEQVVLFKAMLIPDGVFTEEDAFEWSLRQLCIGGDG